MSVFSETQRNLIEKLQSEFQDVDDFQYFECEGGYHLVQQTKYEDKLLLCIDGKSGKPRQLCVITARSDVKVFEAVMGRVYELLTLEEYSLLQVYEVGIAGRTGNEATHQVG